LQKFYLRNGFKETGQYLRYFGVDYEIMSTGKFDLQTFQEMLMRNKPGNMEPVYFTL